METTIIDRIRDHAQMIAAGEHERVKPGMAVAFTEACVPGDAIRQGDLYLVLRDAVPAGYVQLPKPKAADKQLVPGNTQGARHCLDSLAGVSLFRPEKLAEDSLAGPCFSTTRERKVLHPVHGVVVVPAGLVVQCIYQREYDRELQRARRAQD